MLVAGFVFFEAMVLPLLTTEAPATVPVGIGFAWLGYAVLSERRASASAATCGTAVRHFSPDAAA